MSQVGMVRPPCYSSHVSSKQTPRIKLSPSRGLARGRSHSEQVHAALPKDQSSIQVMRNCL